ncbi:hypothetical protein PAHAL_6G031100 [Panicum hallii]|uniref:Uncharacterized protein n=1 Tax=Panicum hallii TaxID=206008 RepID=A0A2S3I039_9POAL|nr:hypothetical protein PAHAL_6G031100 [Panicum hallii]
MGACVEPIDGAPPPHLHETRRTIGLGLPAGGSGGGDPSGTLTPCPTPGAWWPPAARARLLRHALAGGRPPRPNRYVTACATPSACLPVPTRPRPQAADPDAAILDVLKPEDATFLEWRWRWPSAFCFHTAGAVEAFALGWMLPARLVPKAASSVSVKGSSRGSIELKRETCEGAGASAILFIWCAASPMLYAAARLLVASNVYYALMSCKL